MSNPIPADPPREKCHNPQCDCMVEQGQWWCSDYCRTVTERETPVGRKAGVERAVCQCGHPACSAQHAS